MGLVHVQAYGHSSVRSVLWLFWKYCRQAEVKNEVLGGLSATLSATCKAAENDCLERRTRSDRASHRT